MEQPQDPRYRQDLPPPPPTHQQGGPSQSSQYSYQQPRRPSQHQQQYQQPTSPQEPYPSSPQEYQLASSSSQPHPQSQPRQPPQQAGPSQASHGKTHSKSRSFSFHSDKEKGRKRSTSGNHDLEESSESKAAGRLHTKADPSLAINEAEPATIAAMTESSLASLRDIQHRDSLGNPIADPDRSNPTRNRWERPLDTIRSFEAAIDGAYSRKSMVRAETDSAATWNRRSSYAPGAQPRYRPESYYSSRPQSMRPPPEHQGPYVLGVSPGVGPPTARSSMYGYDARGYFDEYSGSYLPAPIRQLPPHMRHRDQRQSHNQNVYRLSHQDRSYETVTSAEGSGQSDQIGYQTDPTSSDNSSIERRSPARRPDPQNDYGMNFSQPKRHNLSIGGGQPPPPPPHGQQGQRPAVPRKQVPSVLKRQVAPPQQAQPVQQQQTAPAEKRKSWFSRRFSKKD